MAKTDTTLNPQEKTLTLAVLEAELGRVKSVNAAPEHEIAVTMYRQRLVRLLKKLNPRGYYY